MEKMTIEIRRLCEPFMKSDGLSAIECVQRLIEEIDHRDKYPDQKPPPRSEVKIWN